jgi:hypothetical protein
VRESASVG